MIHELRDILNIVIIRQQSDFIRIRYEMILTFNFQVQRNVLREEAEDGGREEGRGI
jgi:hypothetical protein